MSTGRLNDRVKGGVSRPCVKGRVSGACRLAVSEGLVKGYVKGSVRGPCQRTVSKTLLAERVGRPCEMAVKQRGIPRWTVRADRGLGLKMPCQEVGPRHRGRRAVTRQTDPQ